MGVLGPVIEIAALPVLDLRQQGTLGSFVAFQFVGHDDTRHKLQALQQSLEKAFSGFAIAASLNENAEDDAMLVNRAPQIMKFALNAY